MIEQNSLYDPGTDVDDGERRQRSHASEMSTNKLNDEERSDWLRTIISMLEERQLIENIGEAKDYVGTVGTLVGLNDELKRRWCETYVGEMPSLLDLVGRNARSQEVLENYLLSVLPSQGRKTCDASAIADQNEESKALLRELCRVVVANLLKAMKIVNSLVLLENATIGLKDLTGLPVSALRSEVESFIETSGHAATVHSTLFVLPFQEKTPFPVQKSLDMKGFIPKLKLGHSFRTDKAVWLVMKSLLALSNDRESLLNYLAIHKEEATFEGSVVYYALYDADDGIALPCVNSPAAIPSHVKLLHFIQSKQYATVAAWCLTVTVGNVDATCESSFKHALHKMWTQRRRKDGDDALLEDILAIASALPYCTECTSIFDFSFTTLSEVLGDAESHELQKQLVSFASRATDATFRVLLYEIHTSFMQYQNNISNKEGEVSERVDLSVLSELISDKCRDSNSTITWLSDHQLDEEYMMAQAGQGFHSQTMEGSSHMSTAEVFNVVSSQEHTQGNASAVAIANTRTLVEKKLFVENLLRSEFHYDDQLQPPSEVSTEGQKLRKALNLLAKSLYSSNVHFVMELVQNADDNFYNPEQEERVIKFVLTADALEVFNNERGFDESNIASICNVGDSTKVAKAGYIGQKGIGFKSVFSVSDRPELHSNGKMIFISCVDVLASVHYQ